jgi:replication initiator protein RepSA
MLGYRGHVATKSRTFSATYGQLRADRKAHQESQRREAAGFEPLGDRPVIVASQWKFVRSGLAYGERGFVDTVRHRQQLADNIDFRSTSPSGGTNGGTDVPDPS